jgi:SRSO17 transposase
MTEAVERWGRDLEALHERIAPRFRRAEPRRRALGYLRGLLATAERKNGWHLAELLGEPTPDGVQRLLNAAEWDAQAVGDDLRDYVVEHLGSDEAVLVLDETGFLKKGTHSVGVQRQYSGTAGRIENAQVGVFLLYAGPHGAAFLDRALYLPKEWARDAERRERAGVPEEAGFRTKPELARQMLGRAFAAGVPRSWITADTVYGSDRRLRMFLEEHEQPFVLAVPRSEKLWHGGPYYHTASALADAVEPEAWRRVSAGDGAKGPRLYDWALVELWRLQLTPEERRWGHYLLVRRSIEDPSERAYYVVFARRAEAALGVLVHVAGSRWQVEVAFEEAKGACGLDEYEVRKWAAWHRHVTLSLLAHAFLAVVQAEERKRGTPT